MDGQQSWTYYNIYYKKVTIFLDGHLVANLNAYILLKTMIGEDSVIMTDGLLM